MSRVRVAVVGVGHLGKEHARILSGFPEVELVGVVDRNWEQVQQVAHRYNTSAYTDHRILLPQVDAAVVVVPTTYHHTVACDFLDQGIPLLLEKPMTRTQEEADDLLNRSIARKTLIQVGHIERFNPAYVELRRRPLQPRFIQCERLGGFSGRSTDVGVVLDLMIHDLDLILDLVKAPVTSVKAIGATILGGHEDIAWATVQFANGTLAQLSSSRIHPVPVRRMNLWGPEGYAGIDFARRHLTLMETTPELRAGGIDSRRLDPALANRLKAELFGKYVQTEELDLVSVDQLTCELQEFVHCVKTRQQPRCNGLAGREAMHLATAIVESIEQHVWEGKSGSVGPNHWPTPTGKLLTPNREKSVA